MNKMGNFTGLYPVSKTLRFELRPVGRTKEHIEKMDFLASDEEKAEVYVKVKGYIDDFHRKFINKVMSDLRLDWQPLFTALSEYKKKGNADAKAKKSYDDEKKRMRNVIVSKFKEYPQFKDLFSEKIFSNLNSAK